MGRRPSHQHVHHRDADHHALFEFGEKRHAKKPLAADRSLAPLARGSYAKERALVLAFSLSRLHF